MLDEPLNGFTGFARKPTSSFTYDAPAPAQAARSFDESTLRGISDTERRWAWVEIDLGAIRHNTIEAVNHLAPGCCLMAVVKADGYGHGAVECARAALGAGAQWLGVATVDEGVQLRQAGVEAPILVLAEPPGTSIPLLLQYRITPTVYTPEFALVYGETADQHNMRAPYHLAVNTGMNRIGVRAEEVMEFIGRVSFHRALALEGVFTHFATADMPDTLDFNRQLARFDDCVSALRSAGVDPGLVHAANSAAIYRYPKSHYGMARLGIALYGYHPCIETHGIANLQPAMRVKARITQVKTVPVSEGVSYGLHYRGRSSALVCTVPLGYADGLRRNLSGKVNFVLGGQYCPQVGNICMDQCMFEVDMRSSASRARLDPQIGDVVTIVGDEGDAITTITEMANISGTIEHEIAIGFSHRLPRLFFQ